MRYTSSRSGHRRLEEMLPFSAVEPPLRFSSIVHDFNNLLTQVLTILEELQARRAGTSGSLRSSTVRYTAHFVPRSLLGNFSTL